MGAYLILYFTALILALGLSLLSKKNANNIYDKLSVFFMVVMVFFLVFALYTNDPIEELITTIPAFWQFVITALGGAFAIWKVYLNPLKQKVYEMNRELGEVKTTVIRIEGELKGELRRVESELKAGIHDLKINIQKWGKQKE